MNADAASGSDDTAPSSPPLAEVRPATQLAEDNRWVWTFAGVGVAAAALIVAWAFAGRGPEVSVRFMNGYGLKTGDAIKYRGIKVGEVIDVRLSEDLASVEADARLLKSAAHLARAGSRFWVERPHVGLGQIRGLGTIVEGRYLAVMPGPDEAFPQHSFQGMEAPADSMDEREGGLEVILDCGQRHGMQPGSPLSYRGVSIGKLVSVGLSSDAARVETRVWIEPQYASLIRANTVFWRASGLDMSFGLFKGLELDIESLSTLAAGGVSLATAAPPGKRVVTGQRFKLSDKVEPKWREWAPQIALGSLLLPEDAPRPTPIRVALRWLNKQLIGTRAHQRGGWMLLIEGGRLLAPGNMVMPVEGSVDGSSVIAWAGREDRLTPESSLESGELALFAATEVPSSAGKPWPRSRIRAAESPEDCALFADPVSPAVALSVGRLQADGAIWTIDPSVSLDSDWHGAAVVSRIDGKLIGMLVVEGLNRRVLPIDTTLLEGVVSKEKP